MQTYSVRSEDGTLLMTIKGKLAEDIIKNLEGEWRAYQPVTGKRTVCYVLSKDATWVHNERFGAFQMFLWAGTKIIVG